jgi:hypothetical protein
MLPVMKGMAHIKQKIVVTLVVLHMPNVEGLVMDHTVTTAIARIDRSVAY